MQLSASETRCIGKTLLYAAVAAGQRVLQIAHFGVHVKPAVMSGLATRRSQCAIQFERSPPAASAELRAQAQRSAVGQSRIAAPSAVKDHGPMLSLVKCCRERSAFTASSQEWETACLASPHHVGVLFGRHETAEPVASDKRVLFPAAMLRQGSKLFSWEVVVFGMQREQGWTWALVGVTAVWGWTFVGIHDALGYVSPATFLALRFVIAAVALGVILAPRVRELAWREQVTGFWAGLVLFLGFALQTVGLTTATPSNSGFITGMTVVFTPVLGALFLRERLSSTMIGVIVLAVAGLGLLTLRELRVSAGDLWTLACAATFAAHILVLGRTGYRGDPSRIAWVQMATVAAWGVVWAVWDSG